MHRFLPALLICFLFLTGCGSMSKSYLDRAEAAIADRNWETAYRHLEDGFITDNVANRERALALVKQYPALLTGGAATFSVRQLIRMIDSNGLIAGPRHELSRLEMYRVVASREAVLHAEQNIAEAFAQVKQARELEALRLAESRAEIERAKAETAKQREAISARMTQAARAAMVACKDSLECSKTFALTQIYITEHSKMKIQSANDTIIETFTPTEPHVIGARATKIPRAGNTAMVSLDVFCGKPKDTQDIYNCMVASTKVYEGFPSFIQRTLID